MKVDSSKIISDTLNDFTTSQYQKHKFSKLKLHVNEDVYFNLHRHFLTPTNITIDVKKFLDEIQCYDQWFQPWGIQHSDIPRYGLALVNQTGHLIHNDPINGSLHEWNKKYPDNPLIETDCTQMTEVMELKSLEPLRILDRHWCRSNILKWNKGAYFKPHIDTILPSPWLRFWATTDVENFIIRHDDGNGNLKVFDGIEPGRLYLIDTHVVHDAISYNDNVYQLFLSTLPSALDIVKEQLCAV